MGFAFWQHYCSDVAHLRPTRLCTMFGRLLGCYTIYIHFWGILPPNGILPCAKFTLRPSLAFSYIGSVTARPLVVDISQTLQCWTEAATYIRLSGHHVGHWPTFLVAASVDTLYNRSVICIWHWKSTALFEVHSVVLLCSTDLNVRAVHGTLVVFLQNDAGFTKWEPTTERLRELLLAYRPSEPPRHWLRFWTVAIYVVILWRWVIVASCLQML